MEATMVLSGHVGHSVELKQTRTGVPAVTFRVATTPRIRTELGWADGATTWVTVECYRGLAENVAGSVTKGDPVIVQGRVRTQSWIDADGVQHDKLVIEANAIGHDLNRGVAQFSRVLSRPAIPVDDTPPAAAVKNDFFEEDDIPEEEEMAA